MKILIVSPFFPYPTDSGGKMRLYSMVKALSPKHQITLLCLADQGDFRFEAELSPFCRCELVPIEGGSSTDGKKGRGVDWSNAGLRAAAVARGVPRTVAAFLHRRMVEQLRQLLSEERYDIVHLEYVQVAGYCHYLDPDQKRLVSAVEVPSVTSARGALAGQPRGLATRLDLELCRRYEKFLFASSDAVLAMSEDDAETIREISPPAKVFVIPNGVDASLLSLQPSAPSRPTLLFMGGRVHAPNADGLSFFLTEDCWKSLKTQYQEIRLRIIGRGWNALTELASDASIEVIDYVEDHAECFADVSLMIAPIRIGSGTRLKILEAMAAGLPVVSTTIGCEGLSVSDGEELLIADDARSFGQAVSRLLANPALAARLAQNAKEHVRERFVWGQSAERLTDVYGRVAGLRPEQRTPVVQSPGLKGGETC